MNDPCASPHANLPAILGFFECLVPYVSPWVKALYMPLLLPGELLSLPLVPPAPHHFISMFSTPCSGESSLTLPPAPRAPAFPLCHIHQIASSYVISCWTENSGRAGLCLACGSFLAPDTLILGHCWMDGWRMSDGGVLGGAWLCDDLEMPHIFRGFGDWIR